MKTVTNLFPVSIEGGEITVDGRILRALRLTDFEGNVTNVLLTTDSYQQLGQLVLTNLHRDLGEKPN